MDIDKYVSKPTSGRELLELVNYEANVISYRDLHKFDSLEELMDGYKCTFLLFEVKPHTGHWTMLVKLDNGDLEFFNSYSGYPDVSLSFIPKEYRKISNQLIPYLSYLFYTYPGDIVYNQYKFQKSGAKYKTCGRHCVVRYWNKHLSIEDYYDLLTDITSDYDRYVTYLTLP